VKTID